ncbi:LLM class flavin-dependent oxidoreductase [Streptomyces thermocarboxydus]
MALGTSVALTVLRHPYQAAVEARSISALSGAPYVAGFGPGPVGFQQQLRGERYPKPLRAMKEYVSVVRRLLDSEKVAHEGEYFTSGAPFMHVPAPAVEVGLGVLRAGMARTVGEVGDAAITWLTPHWYIGDTLVPAMTEGPSRPGAPGCRGWCRSCTPHWTGRAATCAAPCSRRPAPTWRRSTTRTCCGGPGCRWTPGSR